MYPSDLKTIHGKITISKSELKEQLNIGNDKAEKLLNECHELGAFKIGGTWIIPVEGLYRVLRAGHFSPNHKLMFKTFGRSTGKMKEAAQIFCEIMGKDILNFDMEGLIVKLEKDLKKNV